MLRSVRVANFFKSLDNHQIKSTGSDVWFNLVVTLTASDNPYLQYPVTGVIRVVEQGTHLGISKAVFHQLNADGTLGAPVVVDNPVFTFEGGISTHGK